MGIRETLFQEKLPKFTDAQAAAFFGQYGEIVSVNGRPAGLDLFLVMFAAEKLTCGPLSLNPIVARALCSLLIKHGYGPQPQRHQT